MEGLTAQVQDSPRWGAEQDPVERDPRRARHDAARRFAAIICVGLPFLVGWPSMPSISAWQQFSSAAAVAGLLIVLGGGWTLTAAQALLAMTAAVLVLQATTSPSESVSRPAALAVAVIGMTALSAAAGAAQRAQKRVAAGPKVLATGLLMAGLLSAVIGLAQYHGVAALLHPWVAVPLEPIGMAYGNLRQRNQFATLLSMALVALLWMYGRAGMRGRQGLLAAGALLIAGLAASTSRTGLLQLIVIVAAAGWMGWRERRLNAGATALPPATQPSLLPHPGWLLGALALYALLAWALPWSAVTVASIHAGGGSAGADVEGMLTRLRDGAPPGHSRMLLWSNVLWLIGERPWTGWGWGQLSLAHYLAEYPGPRFVEILDNAHNLPLHLAVELGIPAAVLICGAFLWMVLAARPWQERDPTRLMAWSVLGMIGLHSLVEYPLWYGPFQLVFGLCLGMLWPWRPTRAPADGTETQEAAQAREARARLAARLMATAILAAVGYAGWSYVRVSQPFLPAAGRLAGWQDDPLARLDPDGSDWLFARQVRFAELALTPLTPQTAARVHALAQATLAFSPEPRVVVKLIDSAGMLGLEQEAQFHVVRLRAVYPEAYARWLAGKPPA